MNDSRRCMSDIVAKPHHASEAYSIFATTTDFHMVGYGQIAANCHTKHLHRLDSFGNGRGIVICEVIYRTQVTYNDAPVLRTIFRSDLRFSCAGHLHITSLRCKDVSTQRYNSTQNLKNDYDVDG